MKYLGYLLFSVGLLLLIYAFTMDVSVEVDYPYGNEMGFPERVNNLGLMADRQNYMIFGGVLAIAGLVISFVGGKNSENESNYKVCPKCAEKVKQEALVCRYCSHSFEEQNDLNKSEAINNLQTETASKIIYKNCPACNNPINAGEKECSDCGLVLE